MMCSCTSENLDIRGLVLTHHPGMTAPWAAVLSLTSDGPTRREQASQFPLEARHMRACVPGCQYSDLQKAGHSPFGPEPLLWSGHAFASGMRPMWLRMSWRNFSLCCAYPGEMAMPMPESNARTRQKSILPFVKQRHRGIHHHLDETRALV